MYFCNYLTHRTSHRRILPRMIDTEAEAFVERVKSDMRSALKARERDEASVLQALLATFSNAEAVPVNTGASAMGNGVGSTEASRKNLTLVDLKALLGKEIDELEQVANQFKEPSAYRDDLVRKIVILKRYID